MAYAREAQVQLCMSTFSPVFVFLLLMIEWYILSQFQVNKINTKEIVV